MNSHVTRRTFVAGMGAAAAAAAVPASFALAPTQRIKFGYTAITWGDDVKQAIEDISALGYEGIQLRNNVLTMYKPAEMKDMLAAHKLTFVALSSGEISLDKPEDEQIALHLANAQYVKDSGGLYLQVLDALKAYPRNATPEECKQLGKLLTNLGKRTADIGIALTYHNHMNTLSQMPLNLDLILANSDPKYVKLELDVAHSASGGGDPAKQILQYHDRLLFLHLKDYIDLPGASSKAKYPFKWVELGNGKVDFPAVFAALNKVKFAGWGVVELDHTVSPDVSAKQSAAISKAYLEQKIGVKV